VAREYDTTCAGVRFQDSNSQLLVKICLVAPRGRIRTNLKRFFLNNPLSARLKYVGSSDGELNFFNDERGSRVLMLQHPRYKIGLRWNEVFNHLPNSIQCCLSENLKLKFDSVKLAFDCHVIRHVLIARTKSTC
jgi:hypothetical protein